MGLGDPRDDPDRVAARLKASPIHKALVAALDDWAVCADDRCETGPFASPRHGSGPWRDRVRDPERWERVEGFPAMADMARVEEQPVTLMVAFAAALATPRRRSDRVPESTCNVRIPTISG